MKAGETLALEITNSGVLPHELFVGTAAEQQAHEAFDQPGTLLEYGCRVPVHYAAGIRVAITIN